MRSVHWTTCLAVAAALLASGPEVSATEQVILEGRGCGFDVAEVSPGVYTGHVTGGPVYAGTARRPVAGVYLLCTIQVNAPHHADPDTSLTTVWGVGSASMSPAPVSFRAMPGDTVSSCTEIWVDTGGGHVSVSKTKEGVFVDVGNGNPRCSEQINIGLDDLSVDGWACPFFASLSPGVPGVLDINAEGDVNVQGSLFWDCPPYGTRRLMVAPDAFSDTVAVTG